MPHPFRLESGHNAEIGHTNHILPKRFQGAFRYCDMNFSNPIEIPLKLDKLWEMQYIAYTQKIFEIYLIHREAKETTKIRQNQEKWGCDFFR